jgi:hypothetical protein
MKRASLFTCPACARHVRVGDSACPFCAASLADATRSFTARPPPKVRMSRAALYAFGVGSLTVATACGGAVANGGVDGEKDSGVDTGFMAVDAYGGPPDFDTGIDRSDDTGTGDDTGDESDAGDDSGLIFADAYGGPPDDGGFLFEGGGGTVYGAPFDAAFGQDAADDAAPDVNVGVPYGLPPGN